MMYLPYFGQGLELKKMVVGILAHVCQERSESKHFGVFTAENIMNTMKTAPGKSPYTYAMDKNWIVNYTASWEVNNIQGMCDHFVVLHCENHVQAISNQEIVGRQDKSCGNPYPDIYL